jgi:hypothetical protein
LARYNSEMSVKNFLLSNSILTSVAQLRNDSIPENIHTRDKTA